MELAKIEDVLTDASPNSFYAKLDRAQQRFAAFVAVGQDHAADVVRRASTGECCFRRESKIDVVTRPRRAMVRRS